jgi:hypothetical protein
MRGESENVANARAICGEHVTTSLRIDGVAGWETPDGKIVDREILLVVHPECYLRTPPSEREALLENASCLSDPPALSVLGARTLLRGSIETASPGSQTLAEPLPLPRLLRAQRLCEGPAAGSASGLGSSSRRSLTSFTRLLGDSKRVAADHHVYALIDYREVDRSVALARPR